MTAPTRRPPVGGAPGYILASLLYEVDTIDTPTQILRDVDNSLHPQAEFIFPALTRIDRPSQLAIYEGCGHWFAAWAEAQAIAATERILECYGRHLPKR